MSHLQKLAIVSGLFAASNCLATDYYFDPRFSANQRFDTNLRMLPNPDQENWITTFSPGVDLGFRRENSELKTNFTWNQLIYDNQTELNIDEQLFSGNYRHATERFNWGLDASYASQSNLSTIYSDGVGAAFQPIQLMRKNLSISPSVTYSINPKTNLSLIYSYSDLSYEKNSNVRNLYDYTYNQGSISLSHAYTERDKLGITLSTSLLDMPALKPDIDYSSQSQTSLTKTAQISWDHSFTEQLSANLAFGINHSETDSTAVGYIGKYRCAFANNAECLIFIDRNNKTYTEQAYALYKQDLESNSNFGQIFNASLKKSFEHGSAIFSASQQLSPTAQGNMEQTVLSFTGKYDLTERWRTSIDGSYQISTFPVKQQINNTLFGGDRTYYSFSPKISWQWTPDLSLQLSYSFRQQTFEGLTDPDRVNNSAMFQFNYQPQINRQVK